MTKYLVTCAYDGSNFTGWQRQKNSRSVQGEIEKAITCFDKVDHIIVGSSRTDAKVHALGQRFHWQTSLKLSEYQVVRALNSHLPPDIRALAAVVVPDDFHARYSVRGKSYRYIINNGQYDVIRRNYQTFIRNKLDVEKMKEAAELFIGEHDFTSFCATTLAEKENQVRKLQRLTIEKQDDIITLTFYGNGFLRHMVRMLTQTLIEVGRGKIDKTAVAKMLAAKDKRACRYNAKPEGLYLLQVEYADY